MFNVLVIYIMQIDLPFISLLSYNNKLEYSKSKFTSEIGIQGNLVHTNYAPTYGKIQKQDYAVLNFASSYTFPIKSNNLNLRLGIENIFDSNYSTFSDWNNIPRMGRNIFMNVLYSFN
jgi:iron complex outermembrane receptor protein